MPILRNAVLAALIATCTWAGEAPATLPEALAAAARLNETVTISLARLQRAEGQYRQARSLLLPTLGASGSLNLSYQGERPYSGAPGRVDRAGVQADQALFDAQAIPALRAADRGLAAQRLESTELRRELAFSVCRLYVGVLASERTRSAAEQRLAVARTSYGEVKSRLDAGLAARNDVTRSELEVARADLALTTTIEAESSARLALDDAVGTRCSIALAWPSLAAPPAREIDRLIAIAGERRGDLAAQELRARANRDLIRQVQAGWLPRLAVRGGVDVVDGDSRGSDSAFIRQNDSGPETEWSVALVASWSLFDSGSRAGLAAQRRADWVESTAALARARRTLTLDLERAVIALVTAEAGTVQAEVAERVAKANADEVDARFKAGLATALEQADANASAFSASVDLINRRLDHANAQLALRRLTGLWPLDDTEPPRSDQQARP